MSYAAPSIPCLLPLHVISYDLESSTHSQYSTTIRVSRACRTLIVTTPMSLPRLLHRLELRRAGIACVLLNKKLSEMLRSLGIKLHRLLVTAANQGGRMLHIRAMYSFPHRSLRLHLLPPTSCTLSLPKTSLTFLFRTDGLRLPTPPPYPHLRLLWPCRSHSDDLLPRQRYQQTTQLPCRDRR